MISYTKVLGALAIALGASVAFGQSTDYVSNELLVKFRGVGNASRSQAVSVNSAIGAKTTDVIPQLNVHVVKLKNGMRLNDAVAYYKQKFSVEYVEKNPKHKMRLVPNDPRYNTQYHLPKVKLPEAWDLSQGLPEVVVAIIDSGIDLDHEDLQNKLVPGYDFSDDDNDPTADGDHGVHCAGIAAGDTNNGKGIAGAGFNVKIMPLKIFPIATAANSAEAIMFAADNGAKVISMSYGYYGAETITERNACAYAWNKGAVLVAASGNDALLDAQDNWPANFPNVISVGSTGTQDIRSGFSNWGQNVHVAAPGENIMSTVVNGYANNTGTSMSCPLVAGVVALMFSYAGPDTSNETIRTVLENTTDPVQGNPFKFGRINAFKALSALEPAEEPNYSDPTGVSMWTGEASSGSAADLLASDSAFYSVTTTSTNLGQVGGAAIDFAFVGESAGLRKATLNIETSAVTGATAQLYLWDFTSNKYVLIRAFATRPTVVKRESIPLPRDLSKYVSGGTLRAGVRAIGPNRSPRPWASGPFDFKIGYIQIETQE